MGKKPRPQAPAPAPARPPSPAPRPPTLPASNEATPCASLRLLFFGKLYSQPTLVVPRCIISNTPWMGRGT